MGRDVLRKSRGGLRPAGLIFFDRCNLLDSLYALMEFRYPISEGEDAESDGALPSDGTRRQV